MRQEGDSACGGSLNTEALPEILEFTTWRCTVQAQGAEWAASAFRQLIHQALDFKQRSKFKLNNQERPLLAGIRVPTGWAEDAESQSLICALQMALSVQLAASHHCGAELVCLLHRSGLRLALTTFGDSLPTSPSPPLTHSRACRPHGYFWQEPISAPSAATCTCSLGCRHGYELREIGGGQSLAQASLAIEIISHFGYPGLHISAIWRNP